MQSTDLLLPLPGRCNASYRLRSVLSTLKHAWLSKGELKDPQTTSSDGYAGLRSVRLQSKGAVDLSFHILCGPH